MNNNGNTWLFLVGMIFGAIIGFFAGMQVGEKKALEKGTIRFELKCDK